MRGDADAEARRGVVTPPPCPADLPQAPRPPSGWQRFWISWASWRLKLPSRPLPARVTLKGSGFSTRPTAPHAARTAARAGSSRQRREV